MSKKKYKTIVIGIDQSYKRTGISISADSNLILVKSVDLKKYKNNSQRREELRRILNKVINLCLSKAEHVICTIERIRLRSNGFLNIDYIKSIGALNCLIVDACELHNIEVYSVDTRCWKATIVGSSKKVENDYGVPPEKWLTVQYVINKGFEQQILIKVEGRREKGTFIRDGVKYEYNDDASDSAAISQFYFYGDRNKMQLER